MSALKSVAVAAACLSACLIGCAPHSAPTVSYYRAHKLERQLLVRACLDNPARARRRSDCQNAQRAELIEGLGDLRSLKPLHLPAANPSRASR